MKLYQLDVELSCIAPVLSAAIGTMTLGTDAAMRRDIEGRPALPGSLIRGNLRHAWTIFHKHIDDTDQCLPVDDWLGEKSEEKSNDSNFKPQRARLYFSYWWSDLTWSSADDRRPLYRIRLNTETGTVKSKMLQVIESPYAHGQEVKFSGQIHAWLIDENECTQLVRWLRKGLCYAHMLGAYKGLGFGRIKSVKVKSELVTTEDIVDPKYCEQPSVGLRIRPQEPFCIGKPAIGENNRFDTEEHIPGAVILGALARMMELNGKENWRSLYKHFDAIRISHATPAKTDSQARALAPPLSLSLFNVSNDTVELLDLVDCKKPGWIERYGKQSAPCFQSDWKEKDWDNVTGVLKRPTVNKRLDVHTAINIDTGAALKEKLYSIESVTPGELTWLANVDFGQIDPEERTKTIKEFMKLSALGLYGVGKLKTRMMVSYEAPFAFSYPQRDLATHPLRGGEDDDIVRLTLQTPALLLSPDFAPPTCGSQNLLKETYYEIWNQLSGSSLKLDYFFARHALRGGRHWFGRFRKSAGREHYHPLTLTLEGSVFVLRVIDAEKANRLLQDWQRYGLPQTSTAPGGERWDQNPWIRNNGYGEIAINPVLPFKELLQGQWHEC